MSSDAIAGCERLSIDLAEELGVCGWEQRVLFYGLPRTGEAWSAFERLGVQPDRIVYGGQALSFVVRLARFCRRAGVGVVFTHGFGLHLLVAVGAKLGGARWTFVLLGNPPSEDSSIRRRSRVRAQLARPFVRHEVACSHYVAQRTVEAYGLPASRVITVPNWVRVEEIEERARGGRGTRVPEESPVLLMVARLDPIKDHRTVLAALREVKKSLPGARLRLIGDGSIREELEELARTLGLGDSVEFLGSRQDIPEQLGQADLFVYGTTADEGFGIVLAEAMAAGLPIVCTDIGPCREVLAGGEAGVLVEPGNATALAEAVVALWRDPERRGHLAKQAQAVAEEQYDVKRAADKILNLFR